MNVPRILIVEDETTLAEHLGGLLTQRGCECRIVHDGAKAEAVFQREMFDLVLLDLNLPTKGGMELCKVFRNLNTDVPIIVLTAFSDLDTKLITFDYGADDFISKPFHGEELLAKVNVFLKRSVRRSAHTDHIVIADLDINAATKTVTRAGTRITLTPKEYSLLELLAVEHGRTVSKTEIARRVWDVAYDTGTNTIEVYICFLRNKIDKPYNVKLIHTKPGFGYSIGEEAE